MEQKERCPSDVLGSIRHKKHALLNKFLSKTYHMIDQCDTSIASWCADGSSFVIKDVDQFSKKVLPCYFKHSKFSSFVRQLNFYSFRKLRNDPDLRVTSKSVRFAHEFFRKDQPQLLHKINRITKSQEASSVEIKSLKDDIAEIHEQLSSLSSRLDSRLQSMASAVALDYQQRMTSIAVVYQTMANMAVATTLTPIVGSTTPLAEDKEVAQSEPHSPRSAMSPLDTLSGVAAIFIQNEG